MPLFVTIEGPVLAAMPETQHDYRSPHDLVTQLIAADYYAADFPRLIGLQLFADPREVQQTLGRMGELLNNLGRGLRRYGFEKPV